MRHTYRDLSRFVLTRGLILCVLLLAGTAALLARAGEGGAMAIRFYEYAGVFQFAALMAFASGLNGCVRIEGLLRLYGY